jgi:hypothetical protein
MAVFQIEAGVCTGRGFADVDAAGVCAKFYTWITKNAAAGGPGWTILRDKSTTTDTAAKAITGADTGTERLTVVAHGFANGDKVLYTVTSGSIDGLSTGNYYYVRVIDVDTIELYNYLGYAVDTGQVGQRLNLSSYSAGTLTLTLAGPYIMVSPVAAPTANQAALFMRVGYETATAAQLRVQFFMGWDNTNKVAFGYWGGYILTTVDGGDYAYDFRGGDECMLIQTRISTTWYRAGIDNWVGDANLVEGTDKRGTVVTMTGYNTVTLGTGEAANFTVGNFYYIYDFQNHNWLNYVKVTARDLGLDQITIVESNLAALTVNYPAGAIISAYEHRFYSFGNPGNYDIRFNFNGYNNSIPYTSGNPGYVFPSQDSYFYGYCATDIMTSLLSYLRPDDKGYYAVMRPVLCETYLHSNSTTSNNKAYGTLKNMYATYNSSLAVMQDGRTIGGNNYLYFTTLSYIGAGASGSYAALFLDTESLS